MVRVRLVWTGTHSETVGSAAAWGWEGPGLSHGPEMASGSVGRALHTAGAEVELKLTWSRESFTMIQVLIRI